MKQLRITIFSLLLLAASPSLACYDHEDDYAWWIELPEVEVTSNHKDNDEYNSNNDEEWWQDDNNEDEWNSDSGDYTVYYGNDENNNNSYYSSSDYGSQTNTEITINKYIPNAWRCQDTKNSCVVTAMEYVKNIVKGNTEINDLYRYDFENDYERLNLNYKPEQSGIPFAALEGFVN